MAEKAPYALAFVPRLLADLTPLRESRDYRRLWTGQLVSFIGTQLTMVAVPYQVFLMTRSSLAVGLTSLAQMVPLLVGSLAGGALADARDRRLLIIFANLALTATSVLLALNASLDDPSLWALVALSAFGAGASGIYGPARGALIPMLVRRELLPASAALWQLLIQVGVVVGPALAGLLLARFSLTTVYVIDAVTYGAALFAALRMAAAPPADGGTKAGVGSVVEGLRYLRSNRVVQGTFAADIIAMVFGMPRALFPALALGRFAGGAGTVGLLFAAPGAGALLAAATSGWVGRVHHQGRAVVIAIAAWGAAIAAFGVVHSLPLALLFLAVAGAADVVSAVFRNTILQDVVPDGLRGRLTAIHIFVVTGGPRMGDVEAGVVAAFAGAGASVVSGGLACVVGILVLARALPEFSRYRNSVDA